MNVPIAPEDLERVIKLIRKDLPEVALSLDETLKDYIDPRRARYVAAAQSVSEDVVLEVDESASVSLAEGGAYVQAWLWVND